MFSFGFWLLAFPLNSQNLVYNPGFESDTNFVINEYSQLGAGKILLDGWMVPTDATSDYYNSHQSTIRGHPIPKAKTGEGRVALIMSHAQNYPYREFLTGRLTQPLEKNKKYKVSFYVCRYKYSHHSPLQIGAYFSKDSMVMPQYHSNLKVEPQVKVENYAMLEDRNYWHKVEGVFLANGGEKFITLGNFKQTINEHISPAVKVSNKFTIVATAAYAYIFIDDLAVEEYTEEPEVKTDKKKLFLFLVDASSSMERNNKFKEVRKGVKSSVKKLPYDAEYGIISFSRQSQWLVKPTKSVLYDFTKVLDTLKINGSTNASSAIKFTYEELKNYSDYDVHVVMCTDGKFTLEEERIEEVKNAKHPFYLMQIEGARSAQLDELVNYTGGSYVVSEVINISDDFKQLTISASHQQTKVEYTKAKKGGVVLKYTLWLSVIALVIAFGVL